MTAKNVFILVGEASGDAHAGRVISELKQLDPSINIKGIGGDNLREAGVEIVTDFSELAVMGLVEVLKRYRKLKAIFNDVVALLKAEKPDLLILVDYPGFNLKLAKQAKKLGIPVLYYISPKVWAWRAGRIKTIKKTVDHMAVLFPFEVPIYEAEGVPVTCVGHPLVDAVKQELSSSQAKEKLGLNANEPTIGLFPGSRRSEVDMLLPIMIKAAENISNKVENLNVILPLATGLNSQTIESLLANTSLNIHCVDSDFYHTTLACDAIVAASGTVTLEIALLAVPHFITYRVSTLTYAILSRLVKIPYVGLCNIVTGKNVVLELLQNEVTVDRVEAELMSLLTSRQSKEQATKIQHNVLTALGSSGGAYNTAQLIVTLLEE